MTKRSREFLWTDVGARPGRDNEHDRRAFVGAMLAAPFFPSFAAAPEEKANPDATLSEPAPPRAKFASNRNCFLYAGGDAISGFSATVSVDEDIVAQEGLSLQLNAYPPLSAEPRCVFQQFVFQCLPRAGGIAVLWAMEAWPSRVYRKAFSEGTPCETISAACKGDLYDEAGIMAVIPGARIPAGSTFTIAPVDDGGTITGAVFTFTQPHAKSVTSAVETISNFKFRISGDPVTPDALASSFAYQLNLVGKSDGARAAFASGAGMIAYTATNTLGIRNRAPVTLAFRGTTGETSNIVYGDPVAAKTITQTFRAQKGDS